MAGRLQEFLGHFNRYGVAKTSHFQFICPPIVKGPLFSDASKVLSLRCEATELPGRQLVSEDAHIYGPTYKVPYQTVYQELTLTFLETSTFYIRSFFEVWMNAIFNASTNKVQYPNKTWVDTALTQYDVSARDETDPSSSLKIIAQWALHYCRPTAINQMPVSWAEDGLHRIAVTLAFQSYTLTTFAAPSPPGVSPIKSEPKLPRGSGTPNPFNFTKI